MKLKKLIFSIILIFIFSFCAQGLSYAIKTENYYIGLNKVREESDTGYGIGDPGASVDSGQYLWKFQSYANSTDTVSSGRNLYCVKGGKGFININQKVEYNTGYNLKSEKSQIESMPDTQSTYKSIAGSYYKNILWITDHLYIKGESTASERTSLLKSAGIDYTNSSNSYYNLDDELRITDDDIDVVQQLALWYYTNTGDAYHLNNLQTLTISTADTGYDYEDFESYLQNYNEEGHYRLMQMEALYNYLINGAGSNTDQYDNTNEILPPVSISDENVEIKTSGSYYLFGPIEITKNNDLPYTLSFEVKDKNDVIINSSNVSFVDENGNAIDEQSATEIYVKVPQSIGDTIKVKITGEYKTTDTTLWISGTSNDEQPIIEVKKTGKDFEKSMTATFETTSVKVTKAWNDGNNQDGIRPTSVKVQLKANGSNSGEEITLNSGNSWTYTWNNLPEKSGGSNITYTVEEVGTITGYTSATTGNASTGFTITNTHTPAVTSVKVTKAWNDGNNQDGIRPTSVKVQLKANGSNLGEEITLNSGNNWTYTWNNLPEKSGGSNITYTVEEVGTITGYTSATTGNASTGFTITNTHTPAVTSVKVTKAWNDGNNQDGIRPTSVKVQLKANGSNSGSEITLNSGNSWTYTWNNLPEKSGGSNITYTVEEVGTITGYTSATTGNASTGFTITNTHTPATTSVKVTKAWNDGNNQDGIRPTSVKVQLKANGSNSGEEITLNSGNSWTYTWNNLPEKSGGSNITYTVEEVGTITGYTSATTGNASDGFTITNTHKFYDLSLRKSITKVNGTDTRSTRLPQVDTSKIEENGTAKYNHAKTALEADTNQEIEYTITVYNEGEIAGYAGEIKDYLPAGIEYIGLVNSSDSGKYTVNANKDNTTGKTTLTITNNEKKVLSAYNTATGEIDSVEFKIKCKVTAERGSLATTLTNIAEISDYRDEDENSMSDRDSNPGNFPEDKKNNNYSGGTDSDTTDNYVPGQEDDDDFEKIVVPPAEGEYTIRLQKVSSTNTSTNLAGAKFDVELADGTTKEITSETGYVTIAENVDITEAGIDTIEITETNAPNGYKKLLDSLTVNVTKALNDGTYIVTGVSISDTTNASYDLNNNVISLTIKNEPKEYDLSLRKFITKVNGNDIETSREPMIPTENRWSLDDGSTAKKVHNKEPLTVKTGDKVIYTIRVYNEGELDGTAKEVTDYIPAGLEFIEAGTEEGQSSINYENGWTVEENTVKTSKLENETISAYDGTTLRFKDLQIECKVIATKTEGNNLRNIAFITEDDGDDRDSNPEEVPNSNDYNPTNPGEGKGEEDDDDFDELYVEEITSVRVAKAWNDEDNQDGLRPTSVKIQLKANNENSGGVITLDENNSWTYTWNNLPVKSGGSNITYTVEEVNIPIGYTPVVTGDASTGFTVTNTHIPGTTSVSVTKVWSDGDNEDRIRPTSIKVQLKADGNNYGGEVTLKSSNSWSYTWNNLAVKDGGNDITYTVDEVEEPEGYTKTITGNANTGFTITNTHIPAIKDLALTKFIVGISSDSTFEDGEYLTQDKTGNDAGSSTNPFTRQTSIDTKDLKAGTSNDAVYTRIKEPLVVSKNYYVLYNIRVYNEGEVNLYAGEVKDYLPENLQFVECEFNTNKGWILEGQTVKTNYLSYEANSRREAGEEDRIIESFNKETDDEHGSGLSYKDLPILCRVKSNVTSGQELINTAEITRYEDKDGNILDNDVDSIPDNKEHKNEKSNEEDDDDYEVVLVKDYDLSLRKSITKVNGTDTSSTRLPQVDTSKIEQNGTANYNHAKTALEADTNQEIEYTITVYNEGEIAGYAGEIKDYLPAGIEYIGLVNEEESGKYTVNANKDNTTGKTTLTITNNEKKVLSAYNTATGEIDSVEFKIKCKVTADRGSAETTLTNIAEISDYRDKDGHDMKDNDRDSNPGNFPEDKKNNNYSGGTDTDTTDNYIPGQEDDDDFDKIVIPAIEKGQYSIILIKEDENGEQLNSKAEFEVKVGNGTSETKEVTGRLTIAENVEINAENVGTIDKYTIKETKAPDKYSEFDGTIEITVNKKKNGTVYELDTSNSGYKVTDSEGNEITTDDANVYLRDGNIYVEVKNYEKLYYDLALRNFITKINGEDVETSRESIIPTEEMWEHDNGTTTIKNHTKDALTVKTGDIIRYTIRIYNEGQIDGTALEITDYLPEGLEFIDNEFNRSQGWIADGKVIKTRILENEVIKAYDPSQPISDTNPDYRDVEIECLVIATKVEGNNLRNIAVITEDDGDDIDSSPSNIPTNENYNPIDGGVTGEGEQDDDDFELLKLQQFDLSLRKYITSVDGKGVEREPSVDITTLKNGEDTAKYSHDKNAIEVSNESTIIYTIKVYNEGDLDGYVSKIIDYLPEGLEYVENSEINNKYGWYEVENSNKRKYETEYLSDSLLNAFNGEVLDEAYVQIECKINYNSYAEMVFTNIAEIKEYKNENKDVINDDRDSKSDSLTDGDSTTGTLPSDEELPNYNGGKDTDTTDNYIPGQEDDDDFEKVIVKPRVDLALTKFITAISADASIEPEEELRNEDGTYTRATKVDTTELKAGTKNDAEYTQVKTPLTIANGSYILYNIRVYNEGEVDVYAGEVTDYLPDGIEFVEGEYNSGLGWTIDADGKTVRTSYLSHEKSEARPEGEEDRKLKAFDKTTDQGAGEGLDYKDLPILCKVNNTAQTGVKLVNSAEITEYEDESGVTIDEDIDSKPENLPDEDKNKEGNPEGRYDDGEDDEDYEVVIIKKVDLALTKFITAISSDEKIDEGEYLSKDKTSVNAGTAENPNDRQTAVDTTPLKNGENDAIYKQVKEPALNVNKGDYILYNIRVYNEGQVDVYAGEVTDYLPENLEFVDGDFNKQYGWEADGQTVRTSYLKYVEENKGTDKDQILKAFDSANDDGEGSGLDYKDLPILCRVSEKTESGKPLVNIAEVTKYEDEDGNELPDDVDSTPDNVDEKNEDDDDYETVIVEEFDLSLLKYVSQVIVTEDGTTTTTETHNTGNNATDIIPKVEIHRKKISTTDVKFVYTIRITNEGDIEGYAKEITDYVPEGLAFYTEDNANWTVKSDGVIATRELENTLLKPGESADVQVTFRWINGANNLNLKRNTAEISEDYNEEGIPDRDSTPDNKVDGEDDIDIADVLLSIKTGRAVTYVMLVGAVLIVLASGIILVKKYAM